MDNRPRNNAKSCNFDIAPPRLKGNLPVKGVSDQSDTPFFVFDGGMRARGRVADPSVTLPSAQFPPNRCLATLPRPRFPPSDPSVTLPSAQFPPNRYSVTLPCPLVPPSEVICTKKAVSPPISTCNGGRNCLLFSLKKYRVRGYACFAQLYPAKRIPAPLQS